MHLLERNQLTAALQCSDRTVGLCEILPQDCLCSFTDRTSTGQTVVHLLMILRQVFTAVHVNCNVFKFCKTFFFVLFFYILLKLHFKIKITASRNVSIVGTLTLEQINTNNPAEKSIFCLNTPLQNSSPYSNSDGAVFFFFHQQSKKCHFSS